MTGPWNVSRCVDSWHVRLAATTVCLRIAAWVYVEHVRTTTPKIYSRELVDLVFEQPYCRIANVVEAGIVGRQAASRYLQALVSSGLLREQESGREKLFVNSRLLTLLTAETDAVEPFRSVSEDR